MRKEKPIRIAWVDCADHRQYFKTVIECLEETGLVVRKIEWGGIVKRALKYFQPDLIVVYFGFKSMSTREVIEWIEWFHSQIEGVKVVVMSATWLSEYRADGFIPVPSSRDELLKIVIEILDLKEENYPLIWRKYWEWYHLFYS